MFEFLEKSVSITSQQWSEDTVPLVSISCITYNHENYIRDAIEGFLMQKTTFPVEILIHDDASTDKTASIVREYEEKYPHLIKPIYQTENQYSKRDGTIGRIQRGRARGKYYAICEGDDYWIDPLKLQKQVDFLEANPEYSMCFHNAMLLYEDDKSKNRPFTELEEREYGPIEIFSKWTIPTASVVFRVSMYQKVSHPDFMYGDIVLFLNLATKGKLRAINEVMSVYRIHSAGITNSLRNNTLEYKEKYLKHLIAIKNSFNNKYESFINTRLSLRYIELANLQLRSGKKSFSKSLKKSFLYSYKYNSIAYFIKILLLDFFLIKLILKKIHISVH